MAQGVSVIVPNWEIWSCWAIWIGVPIGMLIFTALVKLLRVAFYGWVGSKTIEYGVRNSKKTLSVRRK